MAQYNNTVFETAEAVLEYITPLRKKGKTIVTTNGCFDIIHAGHIQYLSEAASKGEILVVGINCDEVVKKLKGEGRPVSALKMVDCAFIFTEDDPRIFLKIIKPDIHVKGGDYTEEILEKPVVEAHGGKISIVSFKEGYSTSEIINKIISL